MCEGGWKVVRKRKRRRKYEAEHKDLSLHNGLIAGDYLHTIIRHDACVHVSN